MNSSDYVVSRIRSALATAPEVGSLDIEVNVTGDAVHLSGAIDCKTKRDAAGDVAARTAPGLRIVNELTLLTLTPPEAPEVIDDSAGGRR